MMLSTDLNIANATLALTSGVAALSEEQSAPSGAY
jgi:hypothetical protein